MNLLYFKGRPQRYMLQLPCVVTVYLNPTVTNQVDTENTAQVTSFVNCDIVECNFGLTIFLQ